MATTKKRRGLKKFKAHVKIVEEYSITVEARNADEAEKKLKKMSRAKLVDHDHCDWEDESFEVEELYEADGWD
jgi:hypothetical protein